MDELRHRSGTVSFVPGKGIDVDVIIEQGLQADLDYVPLPPGVLGQTRFFRDGTVRIELSRELSERAETDAVARRRLRSTMAHEVGHVACHTSLHVGDTETFSLFTQEMLGPPTNAEPIMCKEDRIGFRYQGEWWEFQANQCMAALLLPRALVAESTRAIYRDNGVSNFEDLIRHDKAFAAVNHLADEYDVNGAAVLYRLQALGFIPSDVQHGLRFDD